MIDFKQLKRDLEASTPGPWCIHNCESYGDRCTNFYQEIWNDETDILVTTEVTRAHNDGGAANMRLISAAPELARLALMVPDLRKTLVGLISAIRDHAETGEMVPLTMGEFTSAIEAKIKLDALLGEITK